MMLFRNTLGLKFIVVGPMQFDMGSNDPAATWDQSPRHRVRLERPIDIAALPITLAQYRRFQPASINHGVSWHEAVAFCAWLSEQDNVPYRLPTEAEWEAAVHVGAIESVGLEWCHDWYGPYPHTEQADPVGPAYGIARMVRGGVIDQASNHCDPTKYDPARQRGGLPPAFGPIAGRPLDDHRLGQHGVWFRVVRGELPDTPPRPYTPPLAFDGVRQSTLPTHLGPHAERPHYRKRIVMPIPPDGATADEIAAAGFSRFFRNDHHSPALEVMPNGDVLAVFYSSFHEYDPEVGFVGLRLRFGSDEWDWPELAIDLPGVNDHAPLLWKDTDGQTIWLAWGTPQCPGRFPFHFMRSRDNGATWSDVQYPQVVGPIGPLQKTQPINTMLRDSRGTVYLPTDGVGGESVLWASDDDGHTWRDTAGRTFGRHTSFVLLKDGRILGMGGKSTQIDSFMPKSISADGGRTWTVSKTPFPAQTSGQRPCVIRLASGRLFFCGDYQNKQAETPLPGKPVGCYAALSDDDGETWITRTLPGTIKGKKQIYTLGYSVARQAPNGVIHLITSRTIPALHFELNEAWILEGDRPAPDEQTLLANTATSISGVQFSEEQYADGSPRLTCSAGLANDGRYLLHGEAKWFYPSGQLQRTATYALGRRIGLEARFTLDGTPIDQWDHRPDGISVGTTYTAAGQVRTRTEWRDRRMDSPTASS